MEERGRGQGGQGVRGSRDGGGGRRERGGREGGREGRRGGGREGGGAREEEEQRG